MSSIILAERVLSADAAPAIDALRAAQGLEVTERGPGNKWEVYVPDGWTPHPDSRPDVEAALDAGCPDWRDRILLRS
jgi:hypothetical protein